VIKTGGEWVSSIEAEGLIAEAPGVAEAGVKPEAVRAHLLRHVESQRISKYAVPELDRIAFVPEIPKTSVGKINKKVLREQHA
jgi:fatty-acyl-CoA synthase